MTSTDFDSRRTTSDFTHVTPQPARNAQRHDEQQKLVDGGTVTDLVKLFKLLADPTRLQILLLLSERGEANVRAICDLLEQNQPAVSHHLALLRVAGLIDSRRSGKHNFYHIRRQGIHELFDDFFAGKPEEQRAFRFADYVLRYHPPQAPVPDQHVARADAPCQPSSVQR
ncbi:MAG: metalloregulator ArsR/SmtB family transcription factor [Pirellulales bacterium]